MLTGYIKLHRKMTGWGWYSSGPTKDVFLHLLLTANFKETIWKGIVLKPGQVICGRKQLALELGLTERQVRTALEHLEQTGEITKKTTNKYTVVTVENWEKYQISDDDNDQQTTNKRPTSDQQTTTAEECKECQECKEGVCISHKPGRGVLENVILTNEQYEKLCARYEQVGKLIDKVSVWLPEHPRKDHFATCLTFAMNDAWPRVREKYNGPPDEQIEENPLSEEEKAERVKALREKLEKTF